LSPTKIKREKERNNNPNVTLFGNFGMMLQHLLTVSMENSSRAEDLFPIA
jgi:hypothetical protein